MRGGKSEIGLSFQAASTRNGTESSANLNKIIQLAGRQTSRNPGDRIGNGMKRLAVVTPVLDDWRSLSVLVRKIADHLAHNVEWIEIVAVDDGSVENFDPEATRASACPSSRNSPKRCPAPWNATASWVTARHSSCAFRSGRTPSFRWLRPPRRPHRAPRP